MILVQVRSIIIIIIFNNISSEIKTKSAGVFLKIIIIFIELKIAQLTLASNIPKTKNTCWHDAVGNQYELEKIVYVNLWKKLLVF